MRKFLGLGSLLVVSLPLVAAAQPPPPPPPPPGGGGGGAGFEPAEPKMRIDVGLIAGIPQGDLDEGDTSPGINIQFGATVAPNISVFGGIRYIQIQDEALSDAGVDFANYDFGIGARYSVPMSPTAKIFGEAMIIYSTLDASGDGGSESGSGIGFGARGGGVFTVSGNIGIGGALSYSTAEVDFLGVEGDAAWLGLEGFVSFGF